MFSIFQNKGSALHLAIIFTKLENCICVQKKPRITHTSIPMQKQISTFYFLFMVLL